MVQIIQENPKPSTRQRFAEAFSETAGKAATEIPSMLLGQKMMSAENEALKRMGLDLSGISDPELRKSIVSQSFKQKEDKSAEKMANLERLSGTINQLRDLSKGSGVGVFGQFSPTSEAFYNRAQIKTLGSDLLSYYKTLFPRGITQEEFKRIEKDYIPKPGDPVETIQGKLDAFENLIQRQMQSLGDAEQPQGEKIKFNPKNPEHLAKFRQLDKRFKGDRKKVNEALAREFEP